MSPEKSLRFATETGAIGVNFSEYKAKPDL